MKFWLFSIVSVSVALSVPNKYLPIVERAKQIIEALYTFTDAPEWALRISFTEDDIIAIRDILHNLTCADEADDLINEVNSQMSIKEIDNIINKKITMPPFLVQRVGNKIDMNKIASLVAKVTANPKMDLLIKWAEEFRNRPKANEPYA